MILQVLADLDVSQADALRRLHARDAVWHRVRWCDCFYCYLAMFKLLAIPGIDLQNTIAESIGFICL